MSTNSKYSIRFYREDDLEQVLQLLTVLYNFDYATSKKYYYWKYIENPFMQSPVNIVTEFEGKIVGHIGFTGFPWHNRFTGAEKIILAPGAAVVHPEHEGKRLLYRMTLFAIKQQQNIDYDAILNLTAMGSSSKLYRLINAAPLHLRQYLYKTNIVRFLHYCTKYENFNIPRVKYGDGEITVSAQAKPKIMAQLAAALPSTKPILEIQRSEKFYQWRFNNPTRKYAHYFFGPQHQPTAFISLVISWNGLRGYILDWGATNSRNLQRLLTFIWKQKHFDILSVYEMSMDTQLQPLLTKAGFTKNSIVNPFDKKYGELFPAYFIAEFPGENKWLWDGMDLRDKNNWHISNLAREID